MRIAKLLVCLGTVAMAVVSAYARYGLHLTQEATVAGTALKAGDYHLEIIGDKAMIKGEGKTVEAPVKMEETDAKFPATSVRYTIVDGKYRVGEISLGGTKTKVIFNN